MKYIWLTLRWLLSVFLAALLLSCVLRRQLFPAFLSVLALFAIVPLTDPMRKGRLSWVFHPVTRVVLVFAALLGFAGILRVTTPRSIYASDHVRSRIHQIYDEKMTEWPVPFVDRYIATEYGPVHVVISGREGAPPLMLLHASGVSGWSWKYNVAALADSYRIYAIDLIGDSGKSEYTSLDHIVRTKGEQAALYAELADSLGVPKAFVAGASEGGFIASNYALHYPERVEKLALIGPMGYSGAVGAVIRIMLTQYFPIRSFQDSTFAWAFSQHAALQEDFGEWFRMVMEGTTPIKVPPLPLSPEERRSISVPVLFIFGERDRLVGDPRAAEALVQDVPDVSVEILDTGHLVAAERPAETNELLMRFFRS